MCTCARGFSLHFFFFFFSKKRSFQPPISSKGRPIVLRHVNLSGLCMYFRAFTFCRLKKKRGTRGDLPFFSRFPSVSCLLKGKAFTFFPWSSSVNDASSDSRILLDTRYLRSTTHTHARKKRKRETESEDSFFFSFLRDEYVRMYSQRARRY